jgi:hypothetical protein
VRAAGPQGFLFKAEAAAAVLFGVMGVATIFWRDWIEAIFGWDPDHHNGSFEWFIVAALLIAAVLLGFLARRSYRSLRLAT